MTDDDLMTIDDLRRCLKVPRSTLYKWLNTGRGPRSIKLPNGSRRFRRSDYLQWLEEREKGFA
ncbi:excisionase [Spongiactinospora rosea]|uniref:Excisionase n=2 Tax=Spongiactinospora rosea TaxID=2248750 RepID=A0A366LKU5_9ACTN|nr:excisionase [Spongiactinospora rosea]